MELRYLFTFLRIIKIPGMFTVVKDWHAIVRAHFLFAAYESGLLKALARPCDRETLVDTLDAKRPEILDALLDIGLATRELSIKNGRFSIKGKRSKAMMADDGDMLAAIIQANLTYYNDAYRNVTDRMRGGELADDLDNIGELVARFSKVGEPILKDFITAIVRGKKPMRVLDVGCGSGILLRSIYDVNQDATGIGLDLDESVVMLAKNNMATWGLDRQFEIVHGDIRDLLKENDNPFDLISLMNILYYFNKEERLDLINKIRAGLSPKGLLAIAMNFHSNGKDIGAANLNLANSSIKGVTPLPGLEDVTSLLKQCGFGNIEVHRFIPGSMFLGIVASA